MHLWGHQRYPDAMGFLKSLAIPQIIRRMMPVATFCPMLPARSEVLLALLLVTYLAVELVAPIAVQIISAALFVPLGIAVVVSRNFLQTDEGVPDPFPFLASLASRPPPVS